MNKDVRTTIVAVLANAKSMAEVANKNGEQDVFLQKIENALKEIKNTMWTAVSSGKYPEENLDVQVTFIDANSGIPLSCSYAYRCDNQWYWTLDSTPVNVEITAWRYNDEPYQGK